MNQPLTKVSICNEVHYNLVRMLKPASLYEFMMEGKKYNLFLGKFDGLPEDSDQVEEWINAFELEVDNNFWNNGLNKQRQYTTHIFITYQSAYDWYLKYEDLCVQTLKWNLEHQGILFRESDANPKIINESWYSVSWDLIRRIQRITASYFTAKELLKCCRDVAEKYFAQSEQAYIDKHTLLLPPDSTVRLLTPTDQEPQLTERDKGLSAPQQLLFIRLLQKSGLFPKKPDNTDDAPELRAIALLTGLDYENAIKGGKGANAKVNQLLEPRERRAFTPQQIPQKLADLDAVENVARLLNVEPVILAVQSIRADLKKLRDY